MPFNFVKRVLGLVMVLMLCGSVAGAENPPAAPFGLIWGASEDAIRSLGVELTPVETKGYGKSYTASNLTVVLSDADTVFLDFGFRNALYRVGIAGKEVDDDRYGLQIRGRFGELEKALEAKYGKGQHFEKLGKYYEDPDRFLMGIAQGGSYFYTFFQKPPISVSLKIAADHGSSGRYVILYERDDLAKQFDDDKAAKEKGAL